MSCIPWKRWHVTNDPVGNNAKPPVEFFQPQSQCAGSAHCFQGVRGSVRRRLARSQNISVGKPGGGAGRTASGLAMLMGNASKILQTVAANIDRDVFEVALQQLADLVLLSDTTGLLTGEEDIYVQGVSVAVQRETQRQRQLEFLQHTNNPTDMGIMGMKGRGIVLRCVADHWARWRRGGAVGRRADEEAATAGAGRSSSAINQRVDQGIQKGVQQGVNKITSELTTALLASQAMAGAGGPVTPPPGGGAAPGMSPIQQQAAQAQGSKPPAMNNAPAGNTGNVVGNQPQPGGPGSPPPPIQGGPG